MRIGHIISRIVFGVIAPLVFTLLCLWLVSYFLLNASWARDYLRTKLPPGLDVAAHRFGPNPFDLRVSGLAFVDPDVTVRGGSVVLNAAILPLGLDSLDATVDEIVVTGDKPKSGPPKPDKEAVDFTLSDLNTSTWPIIERLRGGVRRLWVDLPKVRLYFADVTAARDLTGGLVVQASSCEIRVLGPEFAWGASRCVVELGGALENGGLKTSIVLEDPTGTRIAVYGGLTPTEADPSRGALGVAVDLVISPAIAAAWTGGVIDGWTELRGLRAEGLPLDESPTYAALQWDAFRVAAIGGESAFGTNIIGGAGQIGVWPDGILTRVEVEQQAVMIGAFQYADLSAANARLGRFVLSFDKRAEGALEGLAIDTWTAPSGVTEALVGDATFGVGLAGGAFHGLLTSSAGVIGGGLAVKRSPFGGKISVSAKFDADDVKGALRTSLTGDCEGLTDDAPVQLRGVDLLFEVDGEPPAVGFLRDAATIITPQGSFVWDGFEWTAPETAPEAEP